MAERALVDGLAPGAVVTHADEVKLLPPAVRQVPVEPWHNTSMMMVMVVMLGRSKDCTKKPLKAAHQNTSVFGCERLFQPFAYVLRFG